MNQQHSNAEQIEKNQNIIQGNTKKQVINKKSQSNNKRQTPTQLPQSLSLQSLKTDPLSYINSKTSRETLFKIALILQQQNANLIHKFEASKKYLIDEQNIDQKYRLNADKTDMIRKIDVRYLRQHNKKQIAQKQVLKLYQAQYKQLTQISQQKSQIYNQLCKKKRAKQSEHGYKMQKIQQLSQKLLKLKQQKQRLTDQLNRKKNTQRNQQANQLIQKLLAQYYETIKRVMTNDDSYSIQRINGNMKQAITHANFRHDLQVNNSSNQNNNHNQGSSQNSNNNNNSRSNNNSHADGDMDADLKRKNQEQKQVVSHLKRIQKLNTKISSMNQQSIDI